jgi:hypothetical protein
MPELTNFTVTDTSTIGKLTILTIDIEPLDNGADLNQGVFTNDGTAFQKQLTISIDRLGLAEVFSADIVTIGSPARSKIDDYNSIQSRNTNQNLDLVGLNSLRGFINVEPLVYIDDVETKLIIVSSYATPYSRVLSVSVSNRKVRLTVIGRRR